MWRRTLLASRNLKATPVNVVVRKVSNAQQQYTTLENASEVKHHENLSKDWWNVNGPMAALHALNAIRVPFIRDGIISRGRVEAPYINTTNVLCKQQLLEVGCGGGILSEQLARLGATVIGLDPGEELIKAARKHLSDHSPELCARVEYKMESIAQHANSNCEHYDAVIVSEVLEHVDDKTALLEACVRTLKPGGSIFITTLNKTLPMWMGGVVLGEYLLNIAPIGTHHWNKLISPLDVQRILDTMDCHTVLINGSTYDFWSNTWRWINSSQMCYALQAVKQRISY
ncbi:ubiquinone biosynthesis O-methyltransferase, mitochondrial [Scaptodrosophila lebanonensis]|uniref:Ubiquinone biosynthesis O-methyltransferase, mitochondrial n=1 Tax=Drosophila lebanonensis TaxID=7225 RepID=A0A6J2TVQ8_DROLE|nr:ubiquinone biosynthesis O-methyltransferase, mitochondrial [Scaptodrosophila lebanonensis]